MSEGKSILDQIDKSIFNTKKQQSQTITAKAQSRWDSSVKFWYQVSRAAWWVWKKILYPPLKLAYKPFRFLLEQYKKLWFKCVYSTDKFGNKKFHVPTAGGMILGTLLFLYYIPPILWDASIFMVTYERHIVYLSNSQEIRSNHNIHAVRGCDDTPYCSEQDSIYYMANPDLFNQIWSVINHGSLFFPDHVAAAVPPTVHKCDVLTYGFRWKWLIRNWDWYPDILEVKCVPLEK